MNPSLAMLPCAQATGKLYSVLPDTGAGDFTVSRNGTATFLGSDGLLQTASANVPRLEFNADGSFRGVLVEPSATNFISRSQEFDNAIWGKSNSATVVNNTHISPNGEMDADTINLADVSDSRVQQTGRTILNSTTYSVSIFLKNLALTSGQTFNVRFSNFLSSPNRLFAIAIVDLANGTASYSSSGSDSGTGISGTVFGSLASIGNGWFRLSFTFTTGTAASTTNAGLQIIRTAGSRSFLAWGAQLEVGSVATSYIPTIATTITRPADVITRTGAQDLIGQTEGSVYLDFFYPSGITNTIELFNIRNDLNSYLLRSRINSGGTNNFSTIYNPVGGILHPSFTLTPDSRNKILITYNYSTNTGKVFRNGVLIGQTIGSQPYPTTSQNQIGIGNWFGSVNQVLYNNVTLFKTALSDAQAIALTTL